jgi:hypothetical protein
MTRRPRFDGACTSLAQVLILAAAVIAIGCDSLSLPSAPTPSTPTSTGGLPTAPPASPPTFTLSGVVTDGSALGAGGGLNSGLVTILDGERAGTSVSIFTGGSYTFRDLPAGNLTLSVSSVGYRSAERTVVVDRDLKLDFAVPRTAMSPQPSLVGTWAGQLVVRSSAYAVEFTFVQSGASITGTWRAPNLRWGGTLRGSIDGERSVRGQIAVESGCATSSDIGSGLLEYDERRLHLAARFFGSCGAGDDYSIEIMPNCRLTNSGSVSCG